MRVRTGIVVPQRLECPHDGPKRFSGGVLSCAACQGLADENATRTRKARAAQAAPITKTGAEERAAHEALKRRDASVLVRIWLGRETVRFPGLTNAEVALVERIIADLESA